MKKFLTLLLLFCPLLAYAQQTRQISGQVVDRTDGTPLIGATVQIDPSQTRFAGYNPRGTTTDAQGRFTFTLPSDVERLIISYIGYTPFTAEIAGNTTFTFTLAPSATDIEGVVVTGYQVIEKRKLTSSIKTIEMADIEQIGASSIDQMLAGQVAGLVATPTTGAPGAGTKINIRSTVTLQGVSDPLWVLDGFPLEGNEIPQDWNSTEGIDRLYNMSIAGLNPSDIANITILKDAAATAIYGARAANGVIVITTKKGKRNESLRINASAAAFITTRPNLDKLNLMNASQKVDLELALAGNGRLDVNRAGGGVARILDATPGQRQTLIDQGFSALSATTQDAINALRADGTDWTREIYRPAINQQYSVSLMGGGETMGYYVSGGYFNELGTTRGTGFDRLSLTMKMDWSILPNLTFGASAFINQTTNKSYVSDKYAFMNPNRYTRNVNPYLRGFDENGGYVYDPDMGSGGVNNEDMLAYNFFEERDNTNYRMKTRSVKALFDLSYRPIGGLNLSTHFGLQADDSRTQKDAEIDSYFRRHYAYSAIIDTGTGKVTYLPQGGIIQNWNNEMVQYTWRGQAEYRKVLAQKHELNVMAGLELRGATNENLRTQGFGYNSKTLRTTPIQWPNTPKGQEMAISSDFAPYTATFYENRYLSYYATGSYTYDNRYTFFGSIRYDGTNLFGVDPKYKYTPLWSISGAWNVSREQWLADTPWLNSLRLRGSYGMQGNVDRNTSPYVVGLWNTTNLGGLLENRISVNSPPNQNLRWETTGMWNAALEMSVLDNRLGAVFEVYGTRSKNLITMMPLAEETGFQSTMSNYGEISGKGWELTLNSVNVRTPEFMWETSFTLAHSSNKVEKVRHANNSWLPSIEGYSATAIFGFRTAGLDEHGVPMFWKDGKKVTLQEFVGYRYDMVEIVPGYEEEGVVMNDTQANVVGNMSYLGSGDPKLTGGFNNRFTYKGFDLTVSCNFVLKQLVRRTPFYSSLAMNPGVNYSTEMSKVWSETNPGGIYPVLTGGRRPDGSSWPEPSRNDSDPHKIMSWVMDRYYSGSGNMFDYLDIWTKEMSYLRVNSIRLGYTLPAVASNKLGMKTLRLNFEVRNPFVIATNYDGYFDPESYGNTYVQPMPRVYSIGLNVTF